MQAPAELLLSEFFPFFLVLSRIGGVFLSVPGFGESYIPTRIRLLMALMIALIMAPTVSQYLVGMPSKPFVLISIVAFEFGIGIFSGLAIKVFFAALHYAGGIIGFNVGLMNAFTTDPNFGQQNSIPGVFLVTAATFLIFATNMHHHIILSIVESYRIAPPSELPNFSNFLGDMAEVIAKSLSASLSLAVQLSGPFILLALIFYAGLGVMNRLMPQVPVFFVVQPLIIFLGFFILILVLPTLMTLFMDRVDQFIGYVWAQ